MIEPLFSSPTCFGTASLIGPDKILFSIISLAAAFIIILLTTKTTSTKSKITLAYIHMLFIFLPIFLLTINTTCGMFCMNCHNNMPTLLMYAIPTAAMAAAATGLFVMPYYFMRTNRKRAIKDKRLRNFVKKESAKLKIRSPSVYIVDSGKPIAFSFRSFRSAIFFSMGLKEILNKKELEAVILHELAHIKHRASAMKVSKHIMNIFSPFSLIVKFYDTSDEEKTADSYAAEIQKTKNHILSAKRKIKFYYKHSE